MASHYIDWWNGFWSKFFFHISSMYFWHFTLHIRTVPINFWKNFLAGELAAAVSLSLFAVLCIGKSCLLTPATVLFLFSINSFLFCCSYIPPFLLLKHLQLFNFLWKTKKIDKDTRWMKIIDLITLPSLLAFASEIIFKVDLM